VQNWLWIRNIWQPDSFMAPVIPAFESLKAYASFANVTDYNAVMAGLINQYEGYYNGWFILPLLAGASSFFQTKLTQPPAQSQPKKDSASPFSGRGMQTIFPIISVWFCATSSAIFSLYWLTSNVASIVSHWAMDRFYKRQEEKKKLEGGSTL
jgi:membrane protein insertase Oxa1/YidC/SpoIIIJ